MIPGPLPVQTVVHGQPNIYALFMAISAELLSESGRLVYIVPRSFASGPYFKKFREVLLSTGDPHGHPSLRFKKGRIQKPDRAPGEPGADRAEPPAKRELWTRTRCSFPTARPPTTSLSASVWWSKLKSVLDLESTNQELSIPLCLDDLELVETMRTWPNTLRSLGLEISTGPVVPFRAREFLTDAPSGTTTIPLLWMHHVRPMRVEWPSVGTGKPQWVKVAPESEKLLVGDETYVLLRRFSAKEEKRRLVAAPVVRGSLEGDRLGLENHLNYIRGVSRNFDDELAFGMAALLNSSFLDRYFRVSNGNTQVSATELRAIPLPDEGDIRSIGAHARAGGSSGMSLPEIDNLVARVLSLSSFEGLGRQADS